VDEPLQSATIRHTRQPGGGRSDCRRAPAGASVELACRSCLAGLRALFCPRPSDEPKSEPERARIRHAGSGAREREPRTNAPSNPRRYGEPPREPPSRCPCGRPEHHSRNRCHQRCSEPPRTPNARSFGEEGAQEGGNSSCEGLAMARDQQAEHDELTRKLFAARNSRDVDYLIAALRDPELRYGAAKFLGDLRDSRAVEPLLPLLDANEAGVRVAAIRALAGIQAADAIPRIAEIAMRDEPFLVRSWAIVALGEIGAVSVTEPLSRLLQEPDRRVRRLAARTLGRLKASAAVEPLECAMSREIWYRRRVYRQAIRSIRSSPV